MDFDVPEESTTTFTDPPPFPILISEEQKEVLSARHPEIQNFLDLDQAFPYLNQKNLLTDTEREELQSFSNYSRNQKITKLVSLLPKKGSNALQRFVFCLRGSTDGTAHQELADVLQSAANEVVEKRGDAKTGHTQVLKKTWIKILVVGLLAVLLLWLYASNYLHLLFYALLYQFNLLHSKSLPYLSAHFVGREVEVREITDLIDFSNQQNGVISIVGPPGFGKSTLAIHIGHNVVREGVIVHYVDMIEVSSMQSLAKKVLDSDDSIVAIRNITVDRLFKWARQRHHRTLLIFDNCDDIIHRQKDEFQKVLKKLIQSSHNMKILITSRHKTAQLDQFQYPLRELSTMASCSLLQSVADNLTVCESITNLTGNVPLALRVVSTLLSLPDSPDLSIILASLEKALISTLSSENFPVEERVNASISLSYQYLTPRLQKIGRYLAHFPGSFDQEAACKIMIRVESNRITCSDIAGFLNYLSERSLLEYSQRRQRYQFHRLIREFFLNFVKSSGDAGKNETRRFMISFQLHYTDRLQSVVHVFDQFSSRYMYKTALAALEIERHNIQLLLKYTAESDIHLSAFTTIEKALSSMFLNLRFTYCKGATVSSENYDKSPPSKAGCTVT